MKDDLLEKALKYAKNDDYHVTRQIITDLCNEIERLRELNKDVFSRIQDNKEIFNNAERYLWLRNAAWDVPPDAYAPIVVLSDNKMTTWEWLDGTALDLTVDKWRNDVTL
jgi:hypothetical protein